MIPVEVQYLLEYLFTSVAIHNKEAGSLFIMR